MTSIVVAAGPGDPTRASVIARRLGLPTADALPPAAGDLVLFAGDRLALGRAGERAPAPVAVDFSEQAVSLRSGQGGRLPTIARALGLDRGVRRIIDATAGLGRDAMVLAAAGAHVTMLERHPVLVAMLEDGLARAGGSGTAARLDLVAADAAAYLAGLPADAAPDAVLLDPMFPARGKTALPTKDLQLLRQLLGAGGDDVERLLNVARSVARRRVVIKRPPHGAVLTTRPHTSIAGTRIRFDVFTPRG